MKRNSLFHYVADGYLIFVSDLLSKRGSPSNMFDMSENTKDDDQVGLFTYNEGFIQLRDCCYIELFTGAVWSKQRVSLQEKKIIITLGNFFYVKFDKSSEFNSAINALTHSLLEQKSAFL